MNKERRCDAPKLAGKKIRHMVPYYFFSFYLRSQITTLVQSIAAL